MCVCVIHVYMYIYIYIHICIYIFIVTPQLAQLLFTKFPTWCTPGLLDALGTGHQQHHGLHDAAAAAEAAVHRELAPGRPMVFDGGFLGGKSWEKWWFMGIYWGKSWKNGDLLGKIMTKMVTSGKFIGGWWVQNIWEIRDLWEIHRRLMGSNLDFLWFVGNSSNDSSSFATQQQVAGFQGSKVPV